MDILNFFSKSKKTRKNTESAASILQMKIKKQKSEEELNEELDEELNEEELKQRKSEIAKEGFVTIFCVSFFVAILFQLFPNNKIIQYVSFMVLSILNSYFMYKIFFLK